MRSWESMEVRVKSCYENVLEIYHLQDLWADECIISKWLLRNRMVGVDWLHVPL